MIFYETGYTNGSINFDYPLCRFGHLMLKLIWVINYFKKKKLRSTSKKDNETFLPIPL